MMKYLVLVIVIFSGIPISSYAQTVYKTKTGSKYHTASHYSASTPISLTEAKQLGLGPCAVCKPIVEESNQSNSISPKPVVTKSNTTTSTQCMGITKAGSRCKRMVSSGSYCYQHKN